MRSRVARAVAQLEPSDVIALRKVHQALSQRHTVQQVDGIPQNRTALLQAGCLLAAGGAGYGNKYEPTPVGFAVLTVLESWPRTPEQEAMRLAQAPPRAREPATGDARGARQLPHVAAGPFSVLQGARWRTVPLLRRLP
jgi:hypothetical protein